jgi:hypothetical protein
LPVIDWLQNSPNSPNSTCGEHEQPAIYPSDSILEDYMDYSRGLEESADCYLIGSILPVTAAILERRVYFPWGDKRIYPNIFCMLVGKPGDRKTSAINRAKSIASRSLPENACLPASFSPESMFDEYDENRGGRPDKIWIQGEANTVLGDWKNSSNGERVATRILSLFDCEELSESFRRNARNAGDSPRRYIPETSTSIVFGATFQSAYFQGTTVRNGMERRFLYYIAYRFGRTILRPRSGNSTMLDSLGDRFRSCNELHGPMDLSPDAEALWDEIQTRNRSEIQSADIFDEGDCSRLSAVPTYIIKVAMVFQASRWAKESRGPCAIIEPDILSSARDHVYACVEALRAGTILGKRAETQMDAESILARIRTKFPAISGSIYVSRTQLTECFCKNPNRPNGIDTKDLYSRIIPFLINQGQAQRVPEDPLRSTRREIYAFRPE